MNEPLDRARSAAERLRQDAEFRARFLNDGAPDGHVVRDGHADALAELAESVVAFMEERVPA